MRYLSPSTLLGQALPTPIDKKNIQLGRKKLLAELELSGSDSIDIRGVVLTKGNIIDYFESLQQENALIFHNAVEEDPILKRFLEDQDFAQNGVLKNNDLYNDPQFIYWISPYFQAAFTAFADACFKEVDNNGFTAMLGNPLLMTSQDLEASWTFITRILNNNIALLQYYHENYKKRRPDKATYDASTHLMGFQYISLIQLLPLDRFSETSNKYAFAVMQAAISTFNKKVDQRYAAESWIENAIGLANAPELKTEISNKLVEMRNITSAAGNAGKKKFGLGRFAWIGILILIKVATCNSFHSDDNFNRSIIPVTFRARDSAVRHMLRYGVSGKIDTIYLKAPAPFQAHDSSGILPPARVAPTRRLPDSISTH